MSSEQPVIVSEVNKKATSLDQKVDDLEAFQEDIDAYIEQLESMESTEREAFYNQTDSLHQEIDNAETVDDLLELKEWVEEAIRAPLQQVALQTLDEFLEVLDPDLRESTREEIRNNLGQRLPQDLESAAETYQEITPIVRDLPSTAQKLIATSIERSPSDLLSPNTDVKPLVNATNQRVSDLKELETIFEKAGDWTPRLDFVDTEIYYQGLESSIPIDSITERLDQINEALIDLSGAPFSISTVVESELSECLATSEPSTIATQIQDIREEMTSIQDSYQNIHLHLEALETFGTDQEVFEEEIDDMLVEKSQLGLQDYSTLAAIQNNLDDLDDSLSRFIGDVHQRLKAQRDMIEVLDEGESSDTPEIHLGSGSTFGLSHVQDNLLQALQDCRTHHEWILDQLQVGDEGVEQEQLVGIWQRLSQGEEIPLTGDVQDAVLSLSEQLSLSVVLSSE
ncbi:hypothetical protein ACFQO4_18300 [Saliphagus sp. GCM10025334]